MGIESLAIKIILIVAAIVGLVLINPSKGKRTFIFRKRQMTLSEIVVELCQDGVIVTDLGDKIQVEYHHNPDGLGEAITQLKEAGLPFIKTDATCLLIMEPDA